LENQDENMQMQGDGMKVEKVETSSASGSGQQDKPLFVVTKNNIWKISSGILAIFLIVALVVLFKTDSTIPTAAVVQQPSAVAQPQAQPQAPSQVVQVSIDDDAVKGDANAKVTIVEFSDYECPFCGRFFKETFRDFPLSFHQNAQKASEAAECAGDQNKYWEMHDLLFKNQQALSVSELKKYAGQLGLNQKTFDDCLDSGKNAAEVKKDMAEGSQYGVSGTPAFFINGKKLVGAQPFSAFKAVIDAELAK